MKGVKFILEVLPHSTTVENAFTKQGGISQHRYQRYRAGHYWYCNSSAFVFDFMQETVSKIPPHAIFSEHCSGELPGYNSGPASSSDLRIRRKTTDGRYFLSGKIDWSIMAQTCTHRTEKTFNLTNGKQSNFNHGVLATLYPSIFQTAWSLFIQSDAEIRGSGNQGRCCFEKQRLPH